MSPHEPTSRALYPRLNGGRGGPGADAVARNQRGRLMGAMIEAVWRNGYASTTVGELVSLAGVSKSTFYQHFESKEECFLATFDAGAAVLRERMEAARRANGSSPTSRLEVALKTLAEGAIEQPKAAKLMTTESFAPGAAAVPHRNRFLSFLEEAAAEALGPAALEGDDPLPRAIAGGICHAAYAGMRDGRPEALMEERENLLDWALSYRDAGSPPELPSVDVWDSRPPGTMGHDRRELIGLAAVEVAAERGYGALTIPLVSARAAISNQTFYEHFAGKEEAFLAGFDALTAEVRDATAAAFTAMGGWAEGIVAATRTLLERISGDDLLAAAAMFELPTLGTDVLASRGLIRNSLGPLLGPDVGRDGVRVLSPLVVEAIVGGIATVIQLELTAGRATELPALAPRLAQFALVPCQGMAEARAA